MVVVAASELQTERIHEHLSRRQRHLQAAAAAATGGGEEELVLLQLLGLAPGNHVQVFEDALEDAVVQHALSLQRRRQRPITGGGGSVWRSERALTGAEAARQRGDLLSQDADLRLLLLAVVALSDGGGGRGRARGEERRRGRQSVMLGEEHAPRWRLQEVIVMQGAVV